MVATRLRFKIPANQAGTYYLDLFRELSRHHRKMIRQKQVATVYGGYMIDNPSPGAQGRIDFAVAPDTWVTKKAINRGFAMWRKSIAVALEGFEGVEKQRYSDYKIFLDQGQLGSGSNILSAVDSNDNSIVGTGQSWDYSLLTTQDPPLDQFNLMIVGQAHDGTDPNYQRISLIKSWVDSRPIPQDNADEPEYTSDHLADPLANMFDSGDSDDDIVTRYEAENDRPPYDMDEPYGMLQPYAPNVQNNLQRVATSITNQSNFICNIPGFTAICGLVKIDWQSDTAAEFVLDVESNGVKF